MESVRESMKEAFEKWLHDHIACVQPETHLEDLRVAFYEGAVYGADCIIEAANKALAPR